MAELDAAAMAKRAALHEITNSKGAMSSGYGDKVRPLAERTLLGACVLGAGVHLLQT